MDKQQLEEKIREAATEIFSLAETERHKGSEEFKSLKTKLATNIWNWCNTVFGKSKTSNAGVEIMECINRSLSSFKGNPAGYMNYIAASLKNEMQRANAKADEEGKHLIRLPDKKRRQLKQFLRGAKKYGKDIQKADVQREIARQFNYTEQEVSELVQYHFQSFVQGDTVLSDSVEEFSLFDSALVRPIYGNSDSTPEEAALSKSKFLYLISIIEEQIAVVQERTKPYLSALVTHHLLNGLDEAKVDTERAFEVLCSASFTKNERAQKIIEAYKAGGDFCSQEEVAGSFGRDKTDASRTLKNFLGKVKGKCQLD